MKNGIPIAVDLFSGPGGLSEGFKMAGFEVCAAVDSDRWAAETYRHNHPNTRFIHADIRKISADEILRGTGIRRRWVDLVAGGLPCQGFSLVGRPKIASLNGGCIVDHRNELYKTYFKIVETLKPKFFVMENVQGILTFNDGEIKNDIFKICGEMGYDVDLRILNAADYGVPQHRKRVFFIGNRLEIEDDLFPEPTHQGDNGSNRKGELKPHITLREAISDLLGVEAGGGKEIMGYELPPKNPYQRKMRAWSKKVYNHAARPHNERDLEIFKMIRKGMKYIDLPQNLKPYRDDIFKDKYKVLDPKKPSRTIVAHLSKDGLGFIHPEQNRSITVREAARLQSFPDRFWFMGPRTHQFTQVGNAVPPLLAKAIASHLRNYL